MRGKGLFLLLLGLLAACNTNRPPNLEVRRIVQDRDLYLFLKVDDPEGDPVRCRVDFGDGNVLELPCTNGATLDHRYDQNGSYRVQVSASDGLARSEQTLTLILPPPPRPKCPAPSPQPQARTQEVAPLAPRGWRASTEALRVPGQILVRLPDTVPVGNLSRALKTLGLEPLKAPAPRWALVETPPGQEEAIARALLNQGVIEYAQPVYRYRLLAYPDDPLFTNQRTQYDQMQLLAGWGSLSDEACRPVVAVLDTGVDTDHPDLQAHLLPGQDLSDNDNNPDDYDGHGTLVSGVIGAVTHNSQGVAGSTNNLAYVLPVKVFPNANSSTLAEAIRWAADAGSHLINLSLCVLSNHDYNEDGQLDCAAPSDPDIPDAAIESALEYAYYHGVIAVAASGNDGLDYVGYPASSAYTIAVGSVNAAGNRSNFSNYGGDLDFVAPGEQVTSTFLNNDYRRGSGTSYATPYVSGVLALYLGQHYAVVGVLPGFNQAFNCLANNTNQVDWNEQTGYGIPQADQVLDAADGTCYP